jgi:hypothetical protein
VENNDVEGLNQFFTEQPHKIVEGLTTDHENDIELNF